MKQIKYWFIRNFMSKDKFTLITQFKFKLGDVIYMGQNKNVIYIGKNYVKPIKSTKQ